MRIQKKKIEARKRGRLGERQMDLKSYNTKKVIKKVETYKQKWSDYNAAKTRERIIAESLLLELLSYIEEPKHHVGRRPFSLREKIFCMFTYCYCGYSSRRAISELEIARRRGLIPKTPHFNSILNMFRDQSLTRILHNLVEISALPLKAIEKNASVDGSGFSISSFDRWFDFRTQGYKTKKEWIKLHLIVGNLTNVIISTGVSEGTANDSPFLPDLVKNATKNFPLQEISADKAYSSRNNLQVIAAAGAIPFIPFKSNAKANPKGCKLWRDMYEFFHDNKEEFEKHYHQRSNVESAYFMIKRNYRNNLRMRSYYSQMNEILVKCICHNLAVLVQESFELGLKIDFKDCVSYYFAQK